MEALGVPYMSLEPRLVPCCQPEGEALTLAPPEDVRHFKPLAPSKPLCSPLLLSLGDDVVCINLPLVVQPDHPPLQQPCREAALAPDVGYDLQHASGGAEEATGTHGL